MTDYQLIFTKAESALRKHSWFSDAEFDKKYGKFKAFKGKKRTDNEFFSLLSMIIFYSGFRAATVDKKQEAILKYMSDPETVAGYGSRDVKRILADHGVIRNERKVRACIANARTFVEIVKKHKSFQSYLDSFDASASFDNLLLLKEELEYRFEYLGTTTVLHFLMDMGYDVLKPDRVILRIFKRLGLIESEKQLLKAVVQGRKFAVATGHPIRYIDVVFVKYGQQGKNGRFGLDNGICHKKHPDCKACGLTAFCLYFKNQRAA